MARALVSNYSSYIQGASLRRIALSAGSCEEHGDSSSVPFRTPCSSLLMMRFTSTLFRRSVAAAVGFVVEIRKGPAPGIWLRECPAQVP